MSKTMNLSGKLYQLEVIDRISKMGTPGQGPYVVELDTTAVCDLACPGCISEDLVALGNRFANDRLLEIGQEIIDYGVKAVILIGGGEPLAHPKAGELIRMFGESDVHVGITTNGSFLDRHLEAISKYAQWTRISMDAGTEETFSVLRPTKGGGNKFRKIIANMRLLAEHKKGKMGYSFLIQTPADGVPITNIGEIYSAAVLAREVGCDYYEVKPTYQFREGVEHALMRHPPELMAWAAKEIERLDELETDTFKIIRAINLHHSLSGVQEPQPKEYKECPSTVLRTTVTPTGMFVCPYWRGKERMQIGDLRNQTFKEAWEGEQRRAVMERLDASKDCNFHCLRHATNTSVIEIKRKLNEGVGIDPVTEFDRFI